MKVEIFSLCDFASADAAGKLNIIGVFDTIHASQAPVVHGFCFLATRIRFEKIEEGLKKFKISFVDIDGKPIMPVVEAQVQVRLAPNAQHAIAQVVSAMWQIKLPCFGEYSIDLAIDGRQEASTPLYVRQLPLLPPLPQLPPPEAMPT